MKVYGLVLELHLPQNFCSRQTDRHFPEIVKSCSRHHTPNHANPSKTSDRIFFRNQYFLLFVYKKVKMNLKKWKFYFAASKIIFCPLQNYAEIFMKLYVYEIMCSLISNRTFFALHKIQVLVIIIKSVTTDVE